jgi:hypothetical protein
MLKNNGRSLMRMSRRTILKAADALPLAVGNFGVAALAQSPAAAPRVGQVPFPRSSDIVHLRAARPLGPADAAAGAVILRVLPSWCPDLGLDSTARRRSFHRLFSRGRQ